MLSLPLLAKTTQNGRLRGVMGTDFTASVLLWLARLTEIFMWRAAVEDAEHFSPS